VAVSRGAKVPVYLADLGLTSPLDSGTAHLLNAVSFWALIAALAAAGSIIAGAMIKGMIQSKLEERQALAESVVKNG
jgi:hypothetical protein